MRKEISYEFKKILTKQGIKFKMSSPQSATAKIQNPKK